MIGSGIPTLIIASAWDRAVLKNILYSIGNFKIIGEFSSLVSGIPLMDNEGSYYVFTELEMLQNDGIRFLELLENKKNVRVAIVSRLLRYSSFILFEELKKFKPIIMSPMPLTYCELEKLSRYIIDKLAGDKNEVIPSIKCYVLSVERLSNIKGSITVIGGSTGALTSLYKVLDIFKPDGESLTVLTLHD